MGVLCANELNIYKNSNLKYDKKVNWRKNCRLEQLFYKYLDFKTVFTFISIKSHPILIILRRKNIITQNSRKTNFLVICYIFFMNIV